MTLRRIFKGHLPEFWRNDRQEVWFPNRNGYLMRLSIERDIEALTLIEAITDAARKSRAGEQRERR